MREEVSEELGVAPKESRIAVKVREKAWGSKQPADDDELGKELVRILGGSTCRATGKVTESLQG